MERIKKEDLLRILWEAGDGFVSGSDLAHRLGVSRTAVWKGIGQLREEGYALESVTNRGYRLLPRGDVLSAEGIRRHLRHTQLQIEYSPSVTSTNTLLKTRAAQGAPHGLVLAAAHQTQGRGRMGRTFYSPADTGLYMSILLRPERSAAETTRLTACSAVAVARTVERLSGEQTHIKWVNDVLLGRRKICGILTEASVDWESGRAEYAVVGIGVNLRPPEGDFPPELRDIAGSVFTHGEIPELRCRVAAGILDELMDLYDDPENEACYQDYKNRSFLLGQEILLLLPGREPVPATALDVDRDYALVVRMADGSIRRVTSGEVSVRFR